MKHLQLLNQRARLALNAQYYLPFLDQEDRDQVLEASRKKSRNYQLAVLRKIAIKVLMQLQHTGCFYGENDWQKSFTECLSNLNSTSLNRRELCRVLCETDDLIEIAYVTQEVRQKIWQTAQQQSLLSTEFEKKYREIKATLSTQAATLTALQGTVLHISQEYSQLTGQQNVLTTTNNQGIIQSRPRELPQYSHASTQMRFSEPHIQHLIQTERSARTVFQDLTKEMTQLPCKPPIIPH